MKRMEKRRRGKEGRRERKRGGEMKEEKRGKGREVGQREGRTHVLHDTIFIQ